jgi:Tol biopolymer transport system component
MGSRRVSRILSALLVAAVGAGRAHAFQDTTRVSVDSAGAEGNGESYQSSISSDGRFVVYTSAASNLVAGDNNQKDDVFVHDRSTGTNERVSLDSSGNEGNDTSAAVPWQAISGDGTLIVFTSSAFPNPMCAFRPEFAAD